VVNTDFVLMEINRVLRQNGTFVLCIPNLSQPVSWAIQVFSDLPPMFSARYRSSHVRDFTLKTIKAAIKANGFRIKEVSGTYMFPFNNIFGRTIARMAPRLSIKIITNCEKIAIPKKPNGGFTMYTEDLFDD
jgi:SAM-dependent methyltransferase